MRVSTITTRLKKEKSLLIFAWVRDTASGCVKFLARSSLSESLMVAFINVGFLSLFRLRGLSQLSSGSPATCVCVPVCTSTGCASLGGKQTLMGRNAFVPARVGRFVLILVLIVYLSNFIEL